MGLRISQSELGGLTAATCREDCHCQSSVTIISGLERLLELIMVQISSVTAEVAYSCAE